MVDLSKVKDGLLNKGLRSTALLKGSKRKFLYLGAILFVLVIFLIPIRRKFLINRLAEWRGLGAGNLVPNSSFEKGSGGMPEGWRRVSGSVQGVFDDRGEVLQAAAANFTRNDETAVMYGTHEIALVGDGSYDVDNLFALDVEVSFTAPSGLIKTVAAFYDGDDNWRARVYVDETGTWSWSSSSSEGSLNGEGGNFFAQSSNLRGMLRKHSQNSRQLVTDDGQTFINVADTAYFFFTPSETDWREYLRQDADHGITSIRSDALGGGLSWDMYWTDDSRTQFDLPNFQNMDERVQWLLDNYPDIQVQVKLLPGPSSYGADEAVWPTLPQSVRENLLSYMISRWAAYPNLFFEVTNDTRCSSAYPNTRSMADEVGNYFLAHDPWRHLISFGPTRDAEFCFTEADWVGYIALETSYDLSADWVDNYISEPLHVFSEEDYYETYNTPLHPRYFYRRLVWSWLLSGGSATYGGDWDTLTPYSQSDLSGMDSFPYIVSYFRERGIDLALFTPDDSLAAQINAPSPEGNSGPSRAQVARREYDEFLIYVPNSEDGEVSGFLEGTRSSAERSRQEAALNTDVTPEIQLDLRSALGEFTVEWYRPYDGLVQTGGVVNGGDYRQLTSPWRGYDVVVRLVLSASATPTPIPTPSPSPTPAPSCEFTWPAQPAHSGDSAVRIHGNSSSADCRMEMIEAVEVSPSSWYDFGGWIRTIGLSGEARYRLIFYSDEAGENEMGFADTQGISGTTENPDENGYVEASRSVMPPGSARSVRVQAVLNGSGTAWFDDVWLNQVGGPTPSPTPFLSSTPSPTPTPPECTYEVSSNAELASANSAVQAGEVVCLHEGSYSTPIEPLNSGSSGYYITYRSFTGEEPVVTARSHLDDKSYLVISGISLASDGHTWLSTNANSHHVEIINCSFDSSEGGSWNGIYLYYSEYITLRGCKFGSWWYGNAITVSGGSHILIEGNDFSQAAADHGLVILGASHSVIRNNYFRNPWDRAISARWTGDEVAENVLIEGNLFIDNDWNRLDPHPGEGSSRGSIQTMKFDVSRGIFRNNLLVLSNQGKDYEYHSNISMATYGDAHYLEHLRIYHNTMHRNKGNTLWFSFLPDRDEYVYGDDNRVKNNIITQYNLRPEYTDYSINIASSSLPWQTFRFENNLLWDTDKQETIYIDDAGSAQSVTTAEANHAEQFRDNHFAAPIFVDDSILDEADLRPESYNLDNLRDFFCALSLQDSSPGRREAAPISVVTQSVSGATSIPVDDAFYFSNGNGVVAGDGLVFASGDFAVVSEIPDQNTLVVDRPVSVSEGEGVYLSVAGVAPDVGAYGCRALSPTSTPTFTPAPTGGGPGATATPHPTSPPAATSTPAPSSTPLPSPTPELTTTPEPTSPPGPTSPPLPTSTPAPTPTPFPACEDQTYPECFGECVGVSIFRRCLNFNHFINLAISWAVLLAPLFCLVRLAIGILGYMTATGDTKKMEESRTTMVYALGGLILIGVAWVFLRLANIFTLPFSGWQMWFGG
ncbi:hypothetical protein B5M47_00745 [candidate division CPR3 bacterium 4484_211]|uniref:Right handed beta helix domain-containing protein n=1 Tax=candidate division CPR3 bacterium 4484_211 TaxID=1968527 RepID=A0A1W9NZ48_UNCC3|nr:MAG: hypothetical protein B5M47_00745 [candidate division CPR3 bacterium 4484_211]